MTKDTPQTETLRRVPVAWEALEDAFENNAPEVHSYLSMTNGEVLRVVDGVADPGMHARIAADTDYLRVDPVSSREQYRWMERFIVTVDDVELRRKLNAAIDGKGAFRRFKDVLMTYPVDRERWFAFRSERLRACMETWLEAHGIESVERPEWHVPTADEVRVPVAAVEPAAEAAPRKVRAAAHEATREQARELVSMLATRDLDTAIAFLEFLLERRAAARGRARAKIEGGAEAQRDASDGESTPED